MDYTLMATAALETEITRLKSEIQEIERVIGTRVPPIGTLEDAVDATKAILAKHGFDRPCHLSDKALGIYEIRPTMNIEKQSVKRYFEARDAAEKRMADATSELLADEAIHSWMNHWGFNEVRIMPPI